MEFKRLDELKYYSLSPICRLRLLFIFKSSLLFRIDFIFTVHFSPDYVAIITPENVLYLNVWKERMKNDGYPTGARKLIQTHFRHDFHKKNEHTHTHEMRIAFNPLENGWLAAVSITKKMAIC